MSAQLESRHFFRAKDTVQQLGDGRVGVVENDLALYAVVRWEDGSREEVDQFDPRVVVVERSEPA